MQKEKQYLVDEVAAYLDRTDYVVFVDYGRLSVAETMELRAILAKSDAEFHVVKNRIFSRAAAAIGIEGVAEFLDGQTGIVFGGKDLGTVIKAIQKYGKGKDKLAIKGGLMGGQLVDASKVDKIKDLPSYEVLQAQLLGLLNTPARNLVTVLVAAPRDFVSVLKARETDMAEGDDKAEA